MKIYLLLSIILFKVIYSSSKNQDKPNSLDIALDPEINLYLELKGNQDLSELLSPDEIKDIERDDIIAGLMAASFLNPIQETFHLDSSKTKMITIRSTGLENYIIIENEGNQIWTSFSNDIRSISNHCMASGMKEEDCDALYIKVNEWLEENNWDNRTRLTFYTERY